MVMIEDPKHAVTQRNRLRDLYRTKAFCDLHLRSSDGTVFRTHKLVLATYSDYFRQFASRMKGQTSAYVITLDIESHILSEILDYIYRGYFEIHPETQAEIRKAAQKLELFDILELLDRKQDQDSGNMNQAPPPGNAQGIPPSDGQGTAERTDWGEDRARILKHWHNFTQSTASGQNSNMMTDMDNRYRYPQYNANYMETAPSMAPPGIASPSMAAPSMAAPSMNPPSMAPTSVAPTSMAGGSYLNNPDYVSSQNYLMDQDGGNDFYDDYDSEEDLPKPKKRKRAKRSRSRTKAARKSATKKKKQSKRNFLNLKHLHILKRLKSKGVPSNNRLTRQILRKYKLFTRSKLALGNLGLPYDPNSKNMDGDERSQFPLSQRNHVCKICNRNFTLRSLCRSHVTRKHHDQKNANRKITIKKPPKGGRSLRSRSKTKSKSRARPRSRTTKKAKPKQPKKPRPESARKARARLRKQKRAEQYPQGVICTECGAVRVARKSMITHLEKKHGLSKEEASKHRSVMIQCEIKDCNFLAPVTKLMEAHVKSAHPEVEHKCPLCGYTFYLATVLDKHIFHRHQHPEKLKFTCSFCDKKFFRMKMKKIHEQAKHGVNHGMDKYKCQEPGCEFTTTSGSSLKTHANVHREKMFSCPYCSLKLKTELNVKRHVNKLHLGIRPFLCQMCGDSFGGVFDLRSHIRNRHTTDKEFKCQHCPYMTSNKTQFITHVYRLHGIHLDNRKEIPCPYCPYKCLMKSHLKSHMKKHSTARNFACNLCGKTFTTNDSLQGHMQWVHSDAKFSCTHCDYSTKTQKHLNQHISIQHIFKGWKPYQCPYCPFTCATSGNTRKHVMKRHPGMEVKFFKNEIIVNYMKEVKMKESSEMEMFMHEGYNMYT